MTRDRLWHTIYDAMEDAKKSYSDEINAAILAVLDAIAEPSEAMVADIEADCSKRPAQDDSSDTVFIYRAIIAALRKEIEP